MKEGGVWSGFGGLRDVRYICICRICAVVQYCTYGLSGSCYGCWSRGTARVREGGACLIGEREGGDWEIENGARGAGGMRDLIVHA